MNWQIFAIEQNYLTEGGQIAVSVERPQQRMGRQNRK